MFVKNQTSYQIVPKFFSDSKKLRSYFEKQFVNPYEAQPERFCWDYWYVRDQYRHMRTPAYHYFPQTVYNSFHRHLVEWGRVNLGCHNISPPWLSYYVEGHHQNWHADVPHGPWAFVYSLSPPRRKFLGGRTRIMKNSLLNYWETFSESQDREQSAFFDFIEPEFNQLLVFDARYPHSVEEVRNIVDPLDARLVIHGWFVEPRPYVVGGLSTARVQRVLGTWMSELNDFLSNYEGKSLHGTLTLRIKISKAGRVSGLKILTNTVVDVGLGQSQQSEGLYADQLHLFCQKTLRPLFFPAAKSDSLLTIPLIFK